MILIDSHVHLYKIYNIRKLLYAARKNFERASSKLCCSHGYAAVMIVADTSDDEQFAAIPKCVSHGSLREYEIKKTKEDTVFQIISPEDFCFTIVAGQQIITKERLEVLSLLSSEHFEYFAPIQCVVHRILEKGAVPVLPWSPGKWLGKRGQVAKNMIEQQNADQFMIGDIGGRPLVMPAPSLFNTSKEKGFRILNGSDPLPLPNEESRIGAYGNYIDEELDNEKPASHIRELLKDKSVALNTYGCRIGLIQFIINQFLLRYYRWRQYG